MIRRRRECAQRNTRLLTSFLSRTLRGTQIYCRISRVAWWSSTVLRIQLRVGRNNRAALSHLHTDGRPGHCHFWWNCGHTDGTIFAVQFNPGTQVDGVQGVGAQTSLVGINPITGGQIFSVPLEPQPVFAGGNFTGDLPLGALILPTCGNINAVELLTSAPSDSIFQNIIQTFALLPVTRIRS
jgi:hypothetical protein